MVSAPFLPSKRVRPENERSTKHSSPGADIADTVGEAARAKHHAANTRLVIAARRVVEIGPDSHQEAASCWRPLRFVAFLTIVWVPLAEAFPP